MNKRKNNTISISIDDEERLNNLAELFKNFGDSTRIKILCVLIDDEMSVTDISGKLGMTQPAISQQLRVLKMNGLVKYRREGKSLIYSLADDHVKTILSIGIEHLTEEDA